MTITSKNIVVFINHFNAEANPKLDAQTVLCALSYKESGLSDIVVYDSSGYFNKSLFNQLSSFSILYKYSEKILSFPVAINYCLNNLMIDFPRFYAVYSANDLFVDNNFLNYLIRESSNLNDFGCIIPYLSEVDIIDQNALNYRRTRRPSGMTLNVNVFSPAVLDRGLIILDDKLGGCFNDIVLFYKLISNSLPVYCVYCGNITHIGKSTINPNINDSKTKVYSSSNYKKDKEYFSNHYENLSSKSGFLDLNHYILSQEPLDKILYFFIENLKIKFFQRIIFRIRRFLLKRI